MQEWEVAFTSGMVGIDGNDFLDTIGCLTDQELDFVSKDIKRCYDFISQEHDRRNHGSK